jgi:hypothetical protein
MRPLHRPPGRRLPTSLTSPLAEVPFCSGSESVCYRSRSIVLSGFLVGLIGSVELGLVFGRNELATEEDQGGVIEHSQVPAGIVGEDHEVSRCPYFDSG